MPDTTIHCTPSLHCSPSPQGLKAGALRTLRLLFELAEGNEPAHVGGLAARLGASTSEVADHLLQLELAGLAHAERARLTMAGLVVATRLPAVARDTPHAGGAPGAPARKRPRTPRHLPPGFLALHPHPATGKGSAERA